MQKKDLPSLLSAALPFLRSGGDGGIDPPLLSTLRSVGAGECWHKHGTFLAHLTDVHRILTLWSAPSSLALCGLFHSAYSNSYVNLAIFPPSSASRHRLCSLLGASAERLVHLFCVVPRHPLIHHHLLSQFPDDAQLIQHLAASRSCDSLSSDQPWRKKIQSVLPAEGITVKHIKTGEDLPVSRRVVAAFLMMTMADFSDQLFGFQDDLFENEDGRLEFKGNRAATALWPGDGKPGLWLNSISRMGAIYSLIAKEEEIYLEERKIKNGITTTDPERDEEIELVIPPVFENCTKVLDAAEQVAARDLYWEAVTGGKEEGGGLERAEGLLLGSIEKNPFVGEPHVVLGQVYLGMGRYEAAAAAAAAAEEGLRLMLEWGSGWDKRVSWEGWISWGRVLLMKAKERSWPETPWGILNLGLVK